MNSRTSKLLMFSFIWPRSSEEECPALDLIDAFNAPFLKPRCVVNRRPSSSSGSQSGHKIYDRVYHKIPRDFRRELWETRAESGIQTLLFVQVQ